ncbi:hypothetical protein N4P33_16185 [Streptomyces sp. 15-116A]|uniref:hypothetical protein n=1 Tax=Streptomyces sp. 15-116A TaxID=2259035 RepID=UPI0021B1CF98|nr:hypothetical protein [Streptomyces sp. 15-116A]MCT7353697.1 hypothetical protein [Streptomyces sp. 15-116A]
MPLSTASTLYGRRLGVTGALTAAAVAMSGLGMGSAHATDSAGTSAQATKVAAAKGKVIRISGKKPGCRVHAVVSVTPKTASGYLKSTCEYGSSHVLAGLLSIDNKKVKQVTKRQGSGKTATTNTVKLANPKGTQKICMMGSWNFPLADGPQFRSEARACVKY